MNIARPVNGFHVREANIVTEQLEGSRNQCPWLESAYSNVLSRLKLAGHVSGRALTNPANRVFVEEDPQTGENRLAISYHVLGDTLTILGILIIV
jgi:hypothetical protein